FYKKAGFFVRHMAGVDYFSEYQLHLREVECRGSRMPKMGAGQDNALTRLVSALCTICSAET
ncbi:hypothetical protein, partial [Acetobacter tropicalis]|uniref:hypothetical protein n=1 Tax=Acetobacter tropicalis TaxID=104102 RepID=UPI0005870BDA